MALFQAQMLSVLISPSVGLVFSFGFSLMVVSSSSRLMLTHCQVQKRVSRNLVISVWLSLFTISLKIMGTLCSIQALNMNISLNQSQQPRGYSSQIAHSRTKNGMAEIASFTENPLSIPYLIKTTLGFQLASWLKFPASVVARCMLVAMF